MKQNYNPLRSKIFAIRWFHSIIFQTLSQWLFQLEWHNEMSLYTEWACDWLWRVSHWRTCGNEVGRTQDGARTVEITREFIIVIQVNSLISLITRRLATANRTRVSIRSNSNTVSVSTPSRKFSALGVPPQGRNVADPVKTFISPSLITENKFAVDQMAWAYIEKSTRNWAHQSISPAFHGNSRSSKVARIIREPIAPY